MATATVLDLAALKALVTTPAIVFAQSGKATGEWQFVTGDQSVHVTADPGNGLWAPPDSDPTGATGAWNRTWDGANVEASWFGASPGAAAATNVTALNRAITAAKAAQSANLILGAGTFEIDGTLVYSGSNQGITTIGTIEGSIAQGSAPGNSVLKWTGGASPMIQVTTTYHTFHGFSLQNFGTATHGFLFDHCGRQWINRVKFSQPVGSDAFSTASIELAAGVNYDRVSLCEFEAGPAVLVSAGNGTTLLIDQFMFDSTVGSGAFINIQASLDVLTVREGTFNGQVAMREFIDMSSIGSYRVAVARVEQNEFDSNSIAEQSYIAKIKNCDAFIFEANQISNFGNPANLESMITVTDSRVTLRNNVGYSIEQALARTLDATSFVYAYENEMNPSNTQGLLEANSQSGNLITAYVSGTDITIQGDRASAMANSVHLATLTTPDTTYTTDIARVTDSSHQSYMTKGQVFTIVFVNDSGGTLGRLLFNGTRFTVDNPALAPPPAGKRLAITFVWDGATAREMSRQVDANPAWVAKSATATLAFGERRVAADATSGNIVITIPRADTVGVGGRFLIKKTTAPNVVTVNSADGYLINGASTYVLSARWWVVELESDGTQWFVV